MTLLRDRGGVGDPSPLPSTLTHTHTATTNIAHTCTCARADSSTGQAGAQRCWHLAALQVQVPGSG